MKISALLVLSIFLASCATNQKSRLAATAIGVGVGGVIGAATAPSDERPELHAMYWGGIIGVVTAVAANYYWNDEKDIDVMKLENEKMKAQLDYFQNGPAPILLKSKTGPADRRYFQSGKANIKMYQIDRWVEDGPTRRYHQDMLIETLPIEKGR
ncbi:hypothetical protein [Bdellovibrio sp. NC01]|uniref:hypothetical protein n=1 Tax=Bdellovibrio sp. NC01 TaxID=2220073 RepID=UPI0011599604|nr:hypothetical protein [Bdellovibrio sp. NC01]QDK39665.1 hypothetical protein DOE51_05760 [Bdellovibrio sp. NC01]